VRSTACDAIPTAVVSVTVPGTEETSRIAGDFFSEIEQREQVRAVLGDHRAVGISSPIKQQQDQYSNPGQHISVCYLQHTKLRDCAFVHGIQSLPAGLHHLAVL